MEGTVCYLHGRLVISWTSYFFVLSSRHSKFYLEMVREDALGKLGFAVPMCGSQTVCEGGQAQMMLMPVVFA